MTFNNDLVNKYAQTLNVTNEQFKVLYRLCLASDATRHDLYQSVGATDEDVAVMQGVSPNTVSFIENTNEVALSEDVFYAKTEYDESLYFIEHDADPISELGIDIETFSSIDLATGGVYKYAESDDFEILLFAYSVNNSPVRVVDFALGETLPERIKSALTDKNVLKTAYNASFERVCLSKWLGQWLEPDDWDCTMARAARLALPLSLGQCGAVLGLEQQKMKEGKALINYFCKPCRPTKSNGGRTRNLPQNALDKWKIFKRYNKRDVEVEQQIRHKVTRLEISNTERRAWILDQQINDRGALVDVQLAQKASDMDDEYRERLTREAINLTGLSNPNSVSQLKTWIKSETGIKFDTLDKETVKDAMPRISSLKVKRVLEIRQMLGKSSTAKYKAMLACANKDNRVRGLFQFYGANRTGRFSGRLVQLQNLPQNHIEDLDYARSLVKYGMLDDVEFEYGNVQQTLSELIRTAFIAKEGCTYHVCDFSAIEARVLAWVSGEQWVLDTFVNGGDIYCATASQMFHVPVEKHGVNGHLRQKGKIATLACGYGGGVEAMRKMGGEKMGLTDTEMQENVQTWRKANPHSVRLWRHVENAARTALVTEALPIEKDIRFEHKWGGLCITLPSGRSLFYPRMHVDTSVDRLVYEGMDQEKKIWRETETYGGKLTENIIQAIARDCLIETMLRLADNGFNIVFHIHDETVIEATPDQKLEDIEKIFSQEIPWAKGLPLKGAGYTTPYYLKD